MTLPMRASRALVLTMLVLASAACTRRVQVESEPARNESTAVVQAQAYAFPFLGVFDYVVPLDNGDAVGTMTVTRAGAGFAVAFTSTIGDVTTRNVRHSGNTLTMDISTPHGEGSLEVTWQSRDRATGTVFLGETLEMHVTRRP